MFVVSHDRALIINLFKREKEKSAAPEIGTALKFGC